MARDLDNVNITDYVLAPTTHYDDDFHSAIKIIYTYSLCNVEGMFACYILMPIFVGDKI